MVAYAVMLTLNWEAEALTFNKRENAQSRRHFFDTLPTIVGWVLLTDPSPSHAASRSSDPAEALRQTASKLPGYGPADVYYPFAFQGSWMMKRQVVLSDTSTLDLIYPVRFLPSLQDNAFVADRGFNQASLENAISPGSVQVMDWKASNPNDLRMVFTDGRTKDIKVTKRSSERSENILSSSEYQRVVTQDSINGIPQITAQRILTKWKVSEDGNTCQGIELVYDMGGGGDNNPVCNS